VTRALTRAALILTALMVVAGLGWAALRSRDDALPPRPKNQRPPLMLLTSLPLLFDEEFTLKTVGSPAMKALQSRYRVVPISVADARDLSKGRILLMAHAPAQTAENLVSLDDWVRRGGRLLLLADPLLEWPSKRPLGDPLRPPAMFMDTGLLAHWGLTLDPPDRRGMVSSSVGGRSVVTVSPGRLSGSCPTSGDRFLAHCRVGAGRVTVVADADFLNTAALPPDAQRNLDALLNELAKLESA